MSRQHHIQHVSKLLQEPVNPKRYETKKNIMKYIYAIFHTQQNTEKVESNKII